MFIHKLIATLRISAFGLSLASCSKNDVEAIENNAKNAVMVELDNRVGDQKLVLGSTAYKTAAGENFTTTTFNYFVSNIALKKADGSVLIFPN